MRGVSTVSMAVLPIALLLCLFHPADAKTKIKIRRKSRTKYAWMPTSLLYPFRGYYPQRSYGRGGHYGGSLFYGGHKPSYGHHGKGGYHYDDLTKCEKLEHRFAKAQCAYVIEKLEENNCQTYCESVDDQECKPSADSCTEVSGLCNKGKKCCDTSGVSVRTGGTGTGSGGTQLQMPCPTLDAPPPEAPPEAVTAAICDPSGTCSDSLYPRPSQLKCPAGHACCLVTLD